MPDPSTSNIPVAPVIVPIIAPTAKQAWYHDLHGYAGVVIGLSALILVIGKCMADPNVHSPQDMLNCLIQGIIALGVANAGLAHLTSQPAGG